MNYNETIFSKFIKTSPVPVYPNVPWICKCGVGHKAHETTCVRCDNPRQVWSEEQEK